MTVARLNTGGGRERQRVNVLYPPLSCFCFTLHPFVLFPFLFSRSGQNWWKYISTGRGRFFFHFRLFEMRIEFSINSTSPARPTIRQAVARTNSVLSFAVALRCKNRFTAIRRNFNTLRTALGASNLLPGPAHFWSNRETLYNAYVHFFNSHWQNILKYYYIFFVVTFKNLSIMYLRF